MELINIRNISSSWGINIKDYKGLSERATLIISDDEEKFILKKKASLTQFESELKLLKHLKDNGFQAQFPISDKLGSWIVSYKGDYYCIYNYLDGETFSASESLQNPIAPKLLGRTIAVLNNTMNSINFANEFPNKDLFHMVYGFAVKEIEKMDGSEKLLKVYQQLEKEIKTVVDSLTKQLIHRDSHIHNIVFKDEILTGVIDFEIAEVNVNIFDICYCSTSVLSEVFFKENSRESWIKFVGDLVSEYNQYSLLSTKELKSIWYVMLCIQTIFMAYFTNNKEIYKINKEMFFWIYENKINLENAILTKN
ncbi:phosphotransferase [Psychrobacillus sp. FSL H8-0484]|uniref:phosphotransferase enzyme family protein n=1 Tax=Psychrobacillus sp. FSL H8-0484 TaxID=2921390 RepID=UPI0030F50C97